MFVDMDSTCKSTVSQKMVNLYITKYVRCLLLFDSTVKDYFMDSVAGFRLVKVYL